MNIVHIAGSIFKCIVPRATTFSAPLAHASHAPVRMRRPAAVATNVAKGADAPKANEEDPSNPTATTQRAVPEDSDADPEADVLVVVHQELASMKKEPGQGNSKDVDRPWAKNVRNCIAPHGGGGGGGGEMSLSSLSSSHMHGLTLRDTCLSV